MTCISSLPGQSMLYLLDNTLLLFLCVFFPSVKKKNNNNNNSFLFSVPLATVVKNMTVGNGHKFCYLGDN